MSPLRLRTRLTIWYSVVLTAILVLFALTVTWQQGRIGMRRVDRELEGLTATMRGLLADELSESDTPPLAATEVVATLVAAGRHVAIVAEDGQVLAASPGGPVPRADVPRVRADGNGVTAFTTADGGWRVAVQRVALDGRTYTLVASAPMTDANRERRESQEAMWLGMPLLVFFAAAGGFWLATAALRPISAMAARAATLPVDGSDDLGRTGRDDELGQLEHAFNALVARLRATLQTQRQFMADASHELRTPVSVLRSVADVTLDRAHRDESEYREALSLVGVQTQHVGRLLDDMLMLARADAGGYPLDVRPLYLNELVQECAASLAPLADERGVTLESPQTGDVPMRGDEDLLRRMLLNLLQNAVQHTTSGGRVRVHLEHRGDQVDIVVDDQGPGIPEAERTRIFERFVQLDVARRRVGAGLGLSICRWIAEAHGGCVDLRESSPAGSTFVATLPVGVDEPGVSTAASKT